MSTETPHKKTVVLGLDGATFKLLTPFAEKGWMPNIKRVMEHGVHGELESTMPAMTAPSWTTFATGKNPGKHGIFDFMLPTDSLGNMKFATADDINDTTVYELLDQSGITPILINLPCTYPPKLKDAVTITSLLTQGDEWIFPASLKEEFPSLKNYTLTPDESLRLKERSEAYIEELLNHLDQQMVSVKEIYQKKPWDFFFYLFSHTDWVSHLAYTALEEEHNESAVRVFKKVDEYIGWFMDHLPEGANIVLLSDHGFKSYKKIFYFNRWLEQEGYIKTNTNSDQFRGAATRRAKETDRLKGQKKQINLGTGVFRTLSKLGPLEKLAKWGYHNIIKPYVPVNLKVNVGIDFSQSTVCFPKGSYITNAYVNKDWVYKDGTVSREEYKTVRDEVVEKMRNIKDPEGKPVVKKVMTREEVYGDGAPDEAPDIFFELDEYWLVGHFDSGNLFAENEENKHAIEGVFMAMGPDFADEGKIVDGLKMEDMTPLLLHLNGLPVPEDCDGRVHPNLFAHNSECALRPVVAGPASRKAPQADDALNGSEKDAIKDAISNLKF